MFAEMISTEYLLYSSIIVLLINWGQYLLYLFRRSKLKSKPLLLPMAFGWLLLILYLLLTPLIQQRSPLMSRAEIFSLFGWSILTVYLVITLTKPLQAMGSLVLPTSLLFLLIAASQSSEPLEYIQAGGFSNNFSFWLHILLIVIAYGSFTVSFILAIGYLRGEYQLREKSVDGVFFLFPSLESIDRGLQQSIWIGTSFLLVGMVEAMVISFLSGQINTAWLLDPNVLAAIITGFIYGTILYLRRKSLFTNRRIAYLAIAGFIFIGLLFFSMNYLSRMHLFV